jgi:hypothetical protein
MKYCSGVAGVREQLCQAEGEAGCKGNYQGTAGRATDRAAVCVLSMACSIPGSTSWLTTKNGWPSMALTQ